MYAVPEGTTDEAKAVEVPEHEAATGGRFSFFQSFKKGTKSIISAAHGARLVVR